MTLPIGEGQIPLLAPHARVEFSQAPQAIDKGPGGVAFADILTNMVQQANDAALHADAAQNAFAAGRSDDIHGTMIAMKEADIELRLVSNVRNKLVDAFNDLWRMNF